MHKNIHTCRKAVTDLKLLFQPLGIVQEYTGSSRPGETPFRLQEIKGTKFNKVHTVVARWGVFVKSRKGTDNFVISVHPFLCMSVHIEQLGPHLKYFHEILYFSVLGAICRERSVKSDKNNGHFT